MPHSQTHQEGAFDLISYEIRFGACFVELRKGNTKAKKEHFRGCSKNTHKLHSINNYQKTEVFRLDNKQLAIIIKVVKGASPR